jgi:hypothetical protein
MVIAVTCGAGVISAHNLVAAKLFVGFIAKSNLFDDPHRFCCVKSYWLKTKSLSYNRRLFIQQITAA